MTNVYRWTKEMFTNHKNILLQKKSPSKIGATYFYYYCLHLYYANA